MKKILPINPNPYIRTYTHHGYLHAIISTPDKVSTNSHKVAEVEVKNFNNYTWNNQNEDLQYETGLDNTFKFYSNKWDTNMNIAFWRPCNDSDEIEITIHQQTYSNVWASIAVFLTDNNRDIMTDIDSSYIIQCGNFSKDGGYYQINTNPHVPILSAPTLPLNIHLAKMGERISVQFYDSNMNKSEITIMNSSAEHPLERIGFSVNLGCNSYYEWLFSNYINFYVNSNYSMPIDYLCSIHKDWSLYTNNYFLDYTNETEMEINALGLSLIEYIKLMIRQDKYIETLINDNIHLKISDENGAYFHQNLIYGYDDTLQHFHILYYKNGKVQVSTMLYKDFLSTQNYIDNRKIYIIKYNPGYESYKLRPHHLLQLFQEYQNSHNISCYESQYTMHYYFGIAGLQHLLACTDDTLLTRDIRIGYMLYERSICNRDRIEYLFYKRLFTSNEYTQLYTMSLEIWQLATITMNMIIKQRIQCISDTAPIKEKLSEIIEMEKQITSKIIESFTDL